jgi:hypothetical protein
MIVGATLAGLMIGFLAGLLSFRLKSRWCPRCGEWTFRRINTREARLPDGDGYPVAGFPESWQQRLDRVGEGARNRGHQWGIRTSALLLAVLFAMAGCLPADGDGPAGGAGGNGHVSCGILRPSIPHEVKGPIPDGPNFYQFTSRVEGEVSCNAKVAQIGVTVVFHHSTNGHTGAVTGRTTTCLDKSECTSHADYSRFRLYCKELYRYNDFGQVSAWYRINAADAVKTLPSREGRSNAGATSYDPPEAGCR